MGHEQSILEEIGRGLQTRKEKEVVEDCKAQGRSGLGTLAAWFDT